MKGKNRKLRKGRIGEGGDEKRKAKGIEEKKVNGKRERQRG